MYRTADGEEIFIVDGHVHFWDGSPGNQRNRYAEGWVECFYNYHKNLSPAEYVWPLEQYQRYSESQMMKDLFDEGYVDVAIFQPTYLRDFFTNGWNTTEQDAVIKAKYPDKFILNSAWDPRDEDAGLKEFEEKVKRYDIKGVKLYTAEWKGDSRGYKLSDPWARKYFDKCVDLGVTNIHVHKGPTIWPFNKDAFDVGDVDDAATMYRDAGLALHRRALRPAARRGLLLDRRPGAQRLRRPGRGDALHPRQPALLRRGPGGDAVVARPRPADLLVGLRAVEPEVDHRQVHGLRVPPGHPGQARRDADARGQEEDPGAERGQALRPASTGQSPVPRSR